MEFNEIWTKEKNDQLRQFIKEHKSVDYIRNYFGSDLKHHPKGKYCYKNSNILPYHLFNEIKINPIKLPYSFWDNNSLFYNNKNDYFAKFISNSQKYTLMFIYYEINNITTYNVIFTTTEQFDIYLIKLSEFMTKGYINSNEQDELKNIIEKETQLNDIYGIFKRLSFIIFDLYYKKINGYKLSIGDTDDTRKIDLYRNMIQDSFKNVTESIQIDSYGNKYFIYDIN